MEPVIGSDRLFSAFERMGQSPGAELRGASGPGGSPAEALVRAFEDAMEASNSVSGVSMPGNTAAQGVESAVFPNTEAVGNVAPTSATAPGPAEYVPGQDSSLFRANGTSQADFSTRSVPGQTGEVGPLQSPVELYQAQYQIGMLRAHLSVMTQSSQSLTQSLEAVLKQSG
jgi:hypothetical protein